MYKLDLDKFRGLLNEHVINANDPIPPRIKELEEYFSQVEKLVDVDFSKISFEDINMIGEYQSNIEGIPGRIRDIRCKLKEIKRTVIASDFF